MGRLPVLLLAFLSTGSLAVAEGGVSGTGILLPLQDRAGDPEAVELLERVLREELSRRRVLADPIRMRDALRRLRIRDAGLVPPARLGTLVEDLDVDWFFSATLFMSGRQGVPQIILSGRAVRAGERELAWAGFEAASGLDEMGVLGLGRIDGFEELARQAVVRLVDDFENGPARLGRKAPKRGRDGFLRPAFSLEQAGRIAVIPFDAATEHAAPRAAETVGDIALAVLHRQGLRVVVPGVIEELLRQRGRLVRGELDDLTRAALKATTQADVFLTGAVESYGFAQQGREPDPEVAFSARLLEASTGRILWMNGLERFGSDTQKLFGIGRVRSPGALALRMMDSLVAGLMTPAGKTPEGKRP